MEKYNQMNSLLKNRTERVAFVVRNDCNQYLVSNNSAYVCYDETLIERLMQTKFLHKIEKSQIFGGIKGRNEDSFEFLKYLAKEKLGVDMDCFTDFDMIKIGCDQYGEFRVFVANVKSNDIKRLPKGLVWRSIKQLDKMEKEGLIDKRQFDWVKDCEKHFAEKESKKEKEKTTRKIKEKTPGLTEGERFKSLKDIYLERLVKNLEHGRAVKPCDKECWEYGYVIAKQMNHESFKNFIELMNDENFILSAAKITPNPIDCNDYFYKYINPYILAKQSFRIEFLKAIYLNNNVYRLQHIEEIVENLGLGEENRLLRKDTDFIQALNARLESLKCFEYGGYHCSGLDDKELREYKKSRNDAEIVNKNMVEGLEEILKTFPKIRNNTDAVIA